MRPLQRRSGQGTGQLRAANSLFHAGINREDIDQAGDFQDPADLLLRGGQGLITPASRIHLPWRTGFTGTADGADAGFAELRSGSWSALGFPAALARCLDAAEDGVEAGGESLVAVVGPDVRAEGSQEREAVGRQ